MTIVRVQIQMQSARRDLEERESPEDGTDCPCDNRPRLFHSAQLRGQRGARSCRRVIWDVCIAAQTRKDYRATMWMRTPSNTDVGCARTPRHFRGSPPWLIAVHARVRRQRCSQVGLGRKPITTRIRTAMQWPNSWAAHRDVRHEPPRRRHSGESQSCDVQSGTATRRSRAVSACRRCGRRRARGAGHRAVHPVRDPGHRNTDRARRAIAVVDRRVALSHRRLGVEDRLRGEMTSPMRRTCVSTSCRGCSE
jgi:hypothetical protein